MSVRAAALLVALLVCWGPARAEERQMPPQAVAYSQAMQTYFRHPEPLVMVERLAALPPGLFTRQDMILTTGVFFAHLIDAEPRVADQLVLRCEANRDLVPVALAAVEFSHHPGRRDLARVLGGEGRELRFPAGLDMRSLDITHPVHLDMLWSSFFATGDGVYIERIAGTLRPPQPQNEAGQVSLSPDDLIAMAAEWSLTVNARDYPEVHAALAAYAARAAAPTGALAAAIVAKADRKAQ